jgi:hypothetical protein
MLDAVNPVLNNIGTPVFLLVAVDDPKGCTTKTYLEFDGGLSIAL